MQVGVIYARTPSLATIERTMLHNAERVLANAVQFGEDMVSEVFQLGEQFLGQVGKAVKVFLRDDQGVSKDEVAQSRLGVEVLRLVNDLVLRI